MKVLGAILAGGRSNRFGTDKAEALIGGRPMIALVAERLAQQTDALVVCGREWDGLPSLPDRPHPGLGPLGGLAAALRYAVENGYDYVLTSGCDLPDLPLDLVKSLAPGQSAVRGQPLLGLWTSELSAALDRHLEVTDDLSLACWIRTAGVKWVEISRAVSNINTPGDLQRFTRSADPQS